MDGWTLSTVFDLHIWVVSFFDFSSSTTLGASGFHGVNANGFLGSPNNGAVAGPLMLGKGSFLSHYTKFTSRLNFLNHTISSLSCLFRLSLMPQIHNIRGPTKPLFHVASRIFIVSGCVGDASFQQAKIVAEVGFDDALVSNIPR